MEQTESKPLTTGERVATVQCTDDEGLIHSFGFGLYLCDDIVGEEAVGAMSAISRITQQPVPKIELENGALIWGTECHVFREMEWTQLLNSPGIVGVQLRDIEEVRAKAPKFLVVKFFIPPRRQIQWLPVSVSNETFQQMRVLESLGRSLHLEGEFLSIPKRFTITLSDTKEDLDVEIVTSMGEEYQQATKRIIEHAHSRLVVQA